MAQNTTMRFALIIAFFGCLSFIIGVVAENKKPASGTPIKSKDAITCIYPNDPSVALGILSILALAASCVAGHVAVLYPYNGKSVPKRVLFGSNSTLTVFFVIAELVTALALTFLIWTTVTESLHLSRNIHKNLSTECPTAKTGLFGGAAFLALDAALFWLVSQMLALNAREDYFDEDVKGGDYDKVYGTDFDASGDGNKV
ncbi:hypothetical protein LUZ60_009556 [Juncus effusus]|nr:hypothetical protein LUZ60_009556 [Juncus effusus]